MVFARGQNLYQMDAGNYAKALKKARDASVVEAQLTLGSSDTGADIIELEREKQATPSKKFKQ